MLEARSVSEKPHRWWKDGILMGLLLGAISCIVPFIWPVVAVGAYILQLHAPTPHPDLVRIYVGVTGFVAVVAGIAGCFNKGWRTVLPVLGIVINIWFPIWFVQGWRSVPSSLF